MPMNQAILGEFDQEMKTTRRLLERVPDDKFDWKPHVKSMSMGRLATHVAELAAFGTGMLTTDGIDFDKGGYKPATATTRAELLALFDKTTAEARAAIASASDEHLMKHWHMIYKGQKMFDEPRAVALRGMALNHLYHHRGQLSVYLRLNDIPVPSIYGPSADEGM